MTPATAAAAEPRILHVEAVEPVSATAARGLFRRGAAIVGNLLLLLAVVWSIPLVILAIAMPVALCLRLVSRIFASLWT